MKLNILITLRAASVAYHFIELLKVLKLDQRFIIHVASQSPATEILTKAGYQTIVLENEIAKSIQSSNFSKLVLIAKKLLDEIQPDVILCGTSANLDLGVDEVIHLVRDRIPAAAFQYHWGQWNKILERGADVQLVLDDEALRLTHLNGCQSAIIVGSPRHIGYENLKIQENRARLRHDLGLPLMSTVHSFFGQALHQLDGYADTVRFWAQTFSGSDRGQYFLYIPNPRESEDDYLRTISIFKEEKLNIQKANHLSPEESILASDYIYSLFSSCSFDAAYLNRFSTAPLVVPVNLFFNQQIRRYFIEATGMQEQPFFNLGIAEVIRCQEELVNLVIDIKQEGFKNKYWLASHHKLPRASLASEKILNIVYLISKESISEVLQIFN